jgi:predicted GIY-YIG superfamily endonuclease
MEHYYIYCLHNENVPEYYVGHTVDLNQRWHKHKNTCKKKNYKVYQYIRDNGGIDNFKMEVLYETYCSLEEAAKLERYYTELLGATLNTQVPNRSKKEYQDKYNPIYYKNNKKTILEKHGIKFNCICGSTTTHDHQARHFKSKKHINFIRENIGY